MTRRREFSGRLAYSIVLVLLITLWFDIGLRRLEGFSWEDDEGTFLVTSQSVFEGHPLYREVWFNYLPGLMGILTTAFGLGGVNVEAARSVIVLFAGLLLFGLAESAYQVAGHRARILAPLLLVITPSFVRLGRAVMAEVPAGAFTMWALLAALLYLRSGRWLWLILAGLLAGGSVLIKYPAAVTVFPIASAVLLHPSRSGAKALNWRTLRHLVLLGFSIAAPIVISVIPFISSAFWTQVVTTYLNSRSAYTVVLGENVTKLAEYLAENNWGLVPLACGGLLWLLRRNWTGGLVAGTWVVGYLVATLGHSPLTEHHLLLVLVPLAWLSSIGLGHLTGLRDLYHRDERVLSVLLLLGLVVYVLGFSSMLSVTMGRLSWAGDAQQEEWKAARLVAQSTHPGDYVISDFPMITFRAKRQAPPWLANLSGMRFRTGEISDQDLQRDTLEYKVRAVVFWENKLYKKAPNFVNWIEGRCSAIYHHVKVDADDRDDDKVRRILVCPETLYP
jgi:4-amino-4-deoxy-L-arabinose transferase-like glycosyltransferase